MHQYLTTIFLNSKNAQSHLAFHQTPSIWTKKFRNSKKFRKVDSALLLLHFSSPLLLLSPSTLECIGAGGDHGAGAEQGRSGARVALERGAHFEGGGDGWSPATRTAGSRWHAVTGTAASGRAARGDGRGQGGGLGEARGDGDEGGGLRDAGDEDGAGSRRARRRRGRGAAWRRRRRRGRGDRSN